MPLTEGIALSAFTILRSEMDRVNPSQRGVVTHPTRMSRRSRCPFRTTITLPSIACASVS